MSVSAEYRKRQQHLQLMAELQQQLAALDESKEYQAEKAFSEQLRALQAEFGMSDRDTVGILLSQRTEAPQGRAYRNPYSGEVVNVVGSEEHPVLRAWFRQYGNERVNSWRV